MRRATAIKRPEDFHQAFAHLMAEGDLDGLVSLYEEGATVLPQPGVEVHGSDQIRAALGQFVSLGARFQVEVERVVRAGDIALVRARWTAQAKGETGEDVTFSGRDGVVVRRQEDGRWLMVVDDANFVA